MLPNSQSPKIAEDGAVMEPACSREFQISWSISLTFRINELAPWDWNRYRLGILSMHDRMPFAAHMASDE